MATEFVIEAQADCKILRLRSDDGLNRLTRKCVETLLAAFNAMAAGSQPMVVTGNAKFFSAGADLNEVAVLSGPEAYEFSKLGQSLMNAIANFPAPVFAAISGSCIGGGLDLALACHRRIASRDAIFGHRGASLGLLTGWGGTQRLPRLIGKGLAAQVFCAADKLEAVDALRIGLIDGISDNPVSEAIRRLR